MALFGIFGSRPDVKIFFNSLNKDTMNLVDEFYDENACFQDPVVRYTDRRQIKNYYAHLYNDLESIRFEFSDEIKQGDTEALVWKMILKTKSLNAGKPVVVDGISYLKFGGREGKVIYHRDYFDMGAFIYEYIPVLGQAIRLIKKRLSQHE